MQDTTPTLKDLTPFQLAYLECALWSGTDNSDDSGGEPLDRNYSFGDIAPATLAEMIADCRDFCEANAELLDGCGLDDGQAGHDFWLSRNGHGAGFWDRGLGDVGQALHDAAKVYGSYDLSVDDGVIFGN